MPFADRYGESHAERSESEGKEQIQNDLSHMRFIKNHSRKITNGQR